MKVDCLLTRNALSNCIQPEVIEKLLLGFPQCFTPTAPEEIIVPKSRIIRAARRYSMEVGGNGTERVIEKDSQLCWSVVLEKFGIPIIAQWYEDPPIEVLSQIRGKTINGPLKVRFMGKDCILVDGIDDDFNLGDTLPDDYCELGIDSAWPLTLTFAQYIDFEN